MNKTILLADDHATCRALAQTYLRREGFEVIEAKNGIEAIKKYQSNIHNIDLLILDILMPGMNGFDVYETITRTTQACPVLFCSGYTGDRLCSEFRICNHSEVLIKPYKGEDLVNKAKKLLNLR